MAIGDILVRIGADITEYQRNLMTAGKLTTTFGSTVAGVAGSTSLAFAAMAAGSTLAIASILNVAKDYETAFVGVRKVLEGTEADFAKLSRGIRDMAKEIPLTTEEIASIAQTAGQLGIAREDILDFTRVIADLGVATTMSSEEAATALARFANITGMSMNDIERLGSTVVHLGNNLATTEKEIVEMGQRLAGAGNQIGLTESQILAFAGALSSVGIRIEAGGTAFSRVFLEMQTAVLDAGDELSMFAKVAGMSSDEFSKAFKDDAATAVLAFIKGLDDINESGGNVAATLADLGLGEIRVRDALMRASSAHELFADSVKLGNTAWEENTALAKEAEQRYGTFASKMKILRNRFKELVLIIGIPLLDVFSDLLDALDPVMNYIEGIANKFEELDDSTKRTIAIFIALVPVLLLAGAAFFAVIAGIGLLIAGVGAVVTGAGAIGLSFGVVAQVLAIVAAIVGTVIAGFTTFSSALIAVWKNSQEFRDKVINSIKKTVGYIIEHFKMVRDLGVEVFAKIREFWDREGGNIVSGFERVFVFLLKIYDFFIDNIWSTFQRVWPSMKKVFLDFVDVVLQVFTIFVDAMNGDWSKLWDDILTLLSMAGSLMKSAIKFVFESAIKTALDVLKFLWDKVVEILTGLVNSAIEILSDWVGSIIDSVTEVKDNIVDWAVGLYETITGKFGEIVDSIYDFFVVTIPEYFEMFIAFMSELPGRVSEFLAKLFMEDIPYLVGYGIGWMIKTVNDGITNVIEFFQKLPKRVWDFLTDTISSIVEWSNETKDVAIETGRSFYNNVIDFVKNTYKSFKEWLSRTITNTKEWAINTKNQAITTGKSFYNNVINYVKNLPSRVWDFLKRTVNNTIKFARDMANKAKETGKKVYNYIVNEIAKLPGRLLRMGREIVQGLVDGITNNASKAWSVATTIANNFIGGFKRAMGIASPSKVMYELAEFLGIGMVDGIVDSTRLVQQASDKLALAATPHIGDVQLSYATPSGLRSSLTSAVNGTVDVNTRDEMLARELRELRRDMTNLRVIMDEYEVGRIVTPIVTEEQEWNDETFDRLTR